MLTSCWWKASGREDRKVSQHGRRISAGWDPPSSSFDNRLLDARLASRTRTQLTQPLLRLDRFVRLRIALDQVPQLLHSVVLLAHLDQGEALFQLRRSCLASA